MAHFYKGGRFGRDCHLNWIVSRRSEGSRGPALITTFGDTV
jgi:hypothetical protein